MSQSKDKTAKKLSDGDRPLSDNPSNLELPDSDTVVSKISFVSPKGRKYQIIKTNERDEYEDTRVEKKRGIQRRSPLKD